MLGNDCDKNGTRGLKAFYKRRKEEELSNNVELSEILVLVLNIGTDNTG